MCMIVNGVWDDRVSSSIFVVSGVLVVYWRMTNIYNKRLFVLLWLLHGWYGN